ncbi:PHD finger 20 isoform X1 [Pelobates cultripes]|uniref:PHD finger protein 20 n=1 Tax=Pelobates cultripes TaxID=61616 RepID=A0AAD1S782_PELCU|nr:PHD finger 20 isoform X1 [Pelobates cultripes]
MTKNPPNRRGIAFEVGAQLEARDRLKKWYAAHIEEIDYEEGKVLIHFKRWNHRYDEWFCWDSPYLRPLEKIQLRREGLVEEEPQVVFRVNEQVLACWSDCRFYPAKITAVNKDGTYTVKFFDGVVQTVKNIHVKAFSKDQTNLSRSKPREKGTENSPSDKHRGKFREQKKTENTSTEKEKSAPDQKPSNQSEKEKKQLAVEKNKPPEKPTVKNEKEDKENISENERDPSADGQRDERSVQNDSLKVPHENGDRRRKRNKPSSSPPSVSSSQTLQPVTLELRRRRISIGSEVQTKRPRLDKSAKKNVSVDEKIDENGVSGDEQKPSDICENGENEEKSVLHLSNGAQENLNVMEETPAPPAVQEESSQELESGHVESGVQTETLPATSPELSETKEPCQLENPVETAAADFSTSPSDDKPEEKMRSMQNDTQEAATVTAAMKRNPRSDHSAKYSREPYTSLQLSLRSSPQDKLNERRRHSTPASNSTHSHRPSLREKSKENEIQKAHRKPERLSDGINDKEKTKEKSKDFLSLKSKKKKKKKKRSKSELSGSEENIDISKELSPKKSPPSKPNNDYKAQCPLRNPPLRSSDHGRRRDTAKLSDEDTLSDSCTESLLWSDDDYNEEIDVTNADEDLEEEEDDDDDEEEGDCEIVRCMCEVQEENDFMIQCEDCLCWQHGVCMGLLEDNVPEKYTCYVCQDPPGQRLSLKYWYDKDWMNEGHMHGLSFLEENYSHQNAKKIVATHQLLGDVQRVIEVLHGLRLKISILQSKEHPDLKFWGQPWKHVLNEKCYMRRNLEEKSCKEDTTNYRTYNGAVDKPSPIPSVEESYITSEHCYQKPRTYYPAVEQRLVVETRNSTLDAGVERIRQSREDSLAERLGWELDRELIKTESESKHNYCKVRECLTKRNPPPESSQPFDNGDTTVNTQLQWQLNLLAHLESLQDEVTHRMDFIEKELDVLESFLDYTGELEPPEPLARLPQLKHRIKQLLTDLGKVEQIALCCST